MTDYTPTTEVIRHAVTFPRERLGEPRPIKPEAFDRWLAEVQAQAIIDAADEAEHTISSGDVAEVAAYVSGESGRSRAIEQRDALLEDPVAWLRQHAQNLKTRQETEQ